MRRLKTGILHIFLQNSRLLKSTSFHNMGGSDSIWLSLTQSERRSFCATSRRLLLSHLLTCPREVLSVHTRITVLLSIMRELESLLAPIFKTIDCNLLIITFLCSWLSRWNLGDAHRIGLQTWISSNWRVGSNGGSYFGCFSRFLAKSLFGKNVRHVYSYSLCRFRWRNSILVFYWIIWLLSLISRNMLHFTFNSFSRMSDLLKLHLS